MPVTRTYCLFDVATVPLPFELSTRTAVLTQNPDYFLVHCSRTLMNENTGVVIFAHSSSVLQGTSGPQGDIWEVYRVPMQ